MHPPIFVKGEPCHILSWQAARLGKPLPHPDHHSVDKVRARFQVPPLPQHLVRDRDEPLPPPAPLLPPLPPPPLPKPAACNVARSALPPPPPQEAADTGGASSSSAPQLETIVQDQTQILNMMLSVFQRFIEAQPSSRPAAAPTSDEASRSSSRRPAAAPSSDEGSSSAEPDEESSEPPAVPLSNFQ